MNAPAFSGRRSERIRLLYLVPQLNDPAVHRRVEMMHLGEVDIVRPAGFHRSAEPIGDIHGYPVLDLGRTKDGRLARRLLSVTTALRRVSTWGSWVGPIDVIMARSLEAVVLARAFRRRFAPGVPLVYESLDIHRLLLGPGPVQSMLRGLEARSMSECSLVLTSSPGFVREYFEHYHHDLPPIAVMENKILATDVDADLRSIDSAARRRLPPPPGPPWVIGWFGLLRCSRSLDLLAGLCRRFPDLVRVELRGRAAANLDVNLESVSMSTPGLTYHGPYDRRRDLLEIYSRVHFSWTPDFSEPGANSDWLLPNRLYEAGPSGCVPIASAGVETGRWLTARGAGVLLEEPLTESLDRWVRTLTPAAYAAHREAVIRIPPADFIDDRSHARDFVARLENLPHAARPLRSTQRN